MGHQKPASGAWRLIDLLHSKGKGVEKKMQTSKTKVNGKGTGQNRWWGFSFSWLDAKRKLETNDSQDNLRESTFQQRPKTGGQGGLETLSVALGQKR